MTPDKDLLRSIEEMAPWHHDVLLRGDIRTIAKRKTDTTNSIVQQLDPRQTLDAALKQILPDGMQGRSFLDCACNCGGYSFAAKDNGAGKVYGFDVREHWIDQARFILDHREADNSDMTFAVADLMALGAHKTTYDVTWFKGIFYHLPDPVTGLKLAADKTNELLFLDTSCKAFDPNMPEAPSLAFKKEGTEEFMSGVYGPSWLPSGPVVLTKLLEWLGFSEIKVYAWKGNKPDAGEQTRNWDRIGLVAARQSGALDGLVSLTRPTNYVESTSAAVPEGKAHEPKAASPIQTQTKTASPTRPIRWEDDISANAADTAPFENGRPISEWSPDELLVINSGRAPKCLQALPLVDLAAKDTLPIPNSQDREGYAVGYDEWYWLSGLRDYHLTMEAADRYGVSVNRLLEIGCASGRVLRHYAVQGNVSEVWGTDINHRHVRWLFEHMPSSIRPIAVPALPQIPAEDNYFDVITAYSVFTHLDVFETAFLAEIRRTLKPGGLAYLTAHTESTWDSLRADFLNDAPGLCQRLKDSNPDFPDTVMKPLATGRTQYRHTDIGPYRAQVFHSTDYIENVWGRFFTIEDIIPYGHEKQTVILARK